MIEPGVIFPCQELGVIRFRCERELGHADVGPF